MSNYCTALPVPTCPTTPAYTGCHTVSTYDHSTYMTQYHQPSVQQTTPIYDQCTSHNQTGKWKQGFGDFEQLKVCGQADILCDLDVGGVINVQTIQSPTSNVVINDTLSVLGNLEVCNIDCPTGTLNLNGVVAIQTLIAQTDIPIVFATAVTVNGTLNACSISCLNGTINIAAPVNFTSIVTINNTLNACTLSCHGATVCVDQIVASLYNSPFVSTVASTFNSTLILPSSAGPCGVQYPVAALTSSQSSIEIGQLVDGSGNRAVNLNTHAIYAAYGVVANSAVQPGVLTANGYQTPTNLNLSVLQSSSTPNNTTVSGGCIRSTDPVGYVANVVFNGRINVPTNTLNTPFLNLRLRVLDASSNIVQETIVNSYTFADGTQAGAATFWSNIASTISGTASAPTNTFALNSTNTVFFGPGYSVCYFLDNRNTTAITLQSGVATVSRVA